MSGFETIDQVDDNTLINDIRSASDFRGTTFSGYKKADVKKQLLLHLCNSRIEESCYWSAEMVCSSYFMELWEVLLFYLGKYIHLANPKLAIYLQKRFIVFRNIMVQGFDELQLRNNPTIRNMFVEIVAIFCISPKKPAMEPVKIKTDQEFDIVNITEKLKAPDTTFSDHILQKKDPKELSIAVNEFCYHISRKDGKIPNMIQACYWLQWIIEFEGLCRRRKRACKGATREHIPVEYKFQQEIIWIVWDALIDSCTDDNYLNTLLTSILHLFCLKFSPPCIKKRSYLLYFAISVVTEPFVRTVQMISDKKRIEHAVSQTSTVYKQIKKSEESPQTEYLFAGLHDQNKVQKSLQQIDMVHSILDGGKGDYIL